MTKLFVNGCSITLGAELGEELRYFDEGTKKVTWLLTMTTEMLTGGLLW